MLFDHDAEIGAFLLLNLNRAKVEGYLYRKDEQKQTQEFEREGKDGKLVKGKEEVVTQVDWYVMDCQGNWFNIKESTNPFLFYLPYFIDFGYAEDKAKIDYLITKDWILNLYHGEPSDTTGTHVQTYIQHENLTDEQAEKMKEAEKTAYYDKFRIDIDLLNKSAEWIGTNFAVPEPKEGEKPKELTSEQQYDLMKKNLLRKLDEFEYDIGDKK